MSKDKKEDKKEENTTQPNTAAPAPAQMEKKISAKIIVGSIGNVDSPRQLYSIIGVCNAVRQKPGTYGEWTGFVGMFEAVRFSDGKRFAAPQAFLPRFAEDLVLTGLNRAQKNDPNASIQFAFIIGVKPSDRQKYEYTVEPVMDTQQNDALLSLRNKVAPRLPAPSTAA